jgi:hypothetical protein
MGPSLNRAPPILSHKHYAAVSAFAAENLLREARRQKGLAENRAPTMGVLDPDRAQPMAGHDAMTIGIEQFRDRSELRLDRMLLQPFHEGTGAYPIGRRDQDPP